MTGILTNEISFRASWKLKPRTRRSPKSVSCYLLCILQWLLIDVDRALLIWTSSNITAGSDTTAILLRTVFHQLLTHPDTMRRLMDELDSAAATGNLEPMASWKQTRSLPYLDACIKEAGRIHPPFGLPLERVVPPDGAEVCGKYIKGGTIVGMNAWVVHRNMEIFGQDCDKWRPERWFCDQEERKKMEASILTVR